MRIEFIIFIGADGGTMEMPICKTVAEAAKALPELAEDYTIEYAIRIVIDGAFTNAESVSEEVFEQAVENLWQDAKDNCDESTEFDYFARVSDQYLGAFGRACERALHMEAAA